MKRATAHEAQRHPWLQTQDDHRTVTPTPTPTPIPAEEKKCDRYAHNTDNSSSYDSKDKLDSPCGPGLNSKRNGSVLRRRIELSEEKCGRDNDPPNQRRADSKHVGCKDEY